MRIAADTAKCQNCLIHNDTRLNAFSRGSFDMYNFITRHKMLHCTRVNLMINRNAPKYLHDSAGMEKCH